MESIVKTPMPTMTSIIAHSITWRQRRGGCVSTAHMISTTAAMHLNKPHTSQSVAPRPDESGRIMGIIIGHMIVPHPMK